VSTGYVRRWHVLGRVLAIVLLAGIGALAPAASAQADDYVPDGPCVRINAGIVVYRCPKVPLHFDPTLCRNCPVHFNVDVVLPPEAAFEVPGLIVTAIDAAVDAYRTGNPRLTAIQVSALRGVARLLDGNPLAAIDVGYLSGRQFVPYSTPALDEAATQVAAGIEDFQRALDAPAEAERLEAAGLAALAAAAKIIGSGIPIPS